MISCQMPICLFYSSVKDYVSGVALVCFGWGFFYFFFLHFTISLDDFQPVIKQWYYVAIML